MKKRKYNFRKKEDETFKIKEKHKIMKYFSKINNY
jgi:hypothetical protein